jgi:serine/threonine protein kinase
MNRLCPDCREPGPADDALVCPHHGLFLVSPAALAQLEAAPLLGQKLDEKYGLVDIVGGGAYGTIYLGIQFPLGRHVAVKVLHDVAFAHKVVRDRFVREAQALARLGSAHTVRLIDFGITRTGPTVFRNLPYIVMELLEGETLEAQLKRGVLSRAEVALVVQGIAESLAEAHALGIVHRDLKPSNVLLTRAHDGRLVPRLIDFGIARLDDATKTESGLVTGTPAYMAPEQARGDSEIGPAADQYALAVMTYEMLAGHQPFLGPDIVSILRMQCNAPPPPLNFPGGARAPAQLESTLHRALAKSAQARFDHVRTFCDALLASLAQADSEIDRLSRTTEGLSVDLARERAPQATDAAATLVAEPLSALLLKDAPTPNSPLDDARTVAIASKALPEAIRRPPVRVAPPAAAQETVTMPSPVRSPPLRADRRLATWALVAAVVGSAGAWLVSTQLAPPARTQAPAETVSAVVEPPRMVSPATAPPIIVLVTAAPPPAPETAAPAPTPTPKPHAGAPLARQPQANPEDAPAPAPIFDARQVASMVALIEQDLEVCRCDSARATAAVVRRAGTPLNEGLQAKLDACRPVDATHQCVRGRLVELR